MRWIAWLCVLLTLMLFARTRIESWEWTSPDYRHNVDGYRDRIWFQFRLDFVRSSQRVVELPGIYFGRYPFTNGFDLRLSLYWPLALGTAFAVGCSLSGRRPSRSGVCPACGYDLRATPDRCPECGHVPSESSVAKSA